MLPAFYSFLPPDTSHVLVFRVLFLDPSAHLNGSTSVFEIIDKLSTLYGEWINSLHKWCIITITWQSPPEACDHIPKNYHVTVSTNSLRPHTTDLSRDSLHLEHTTTYYRTTTWQSPPEAYDHIPQNYHVTSPPEAYDHRPHTYRVTVSTESLRPQNYHVAVSTGSNDHIPQNYHDRKLTPTDHRPQN